MLSHIAGRLRHISLRQLGGCLALLLLAGGLSGCLEDTPPSATKPPATPKPAAARPTATPKPAASAANNSNTATDWTVLVYLDGDNNLEADAIVDYAEMASVGSNAR